jgi:site-specific recombinase XerD
MRRLKGLGFIYQPKYRDRSGEVKTSPTWWISFSRRGKKIRMSSKSNKRTDALRLLKQKLAEVGAGRPVGSDVERTTFEDLATMLADDYKANGRRSLRMIPIRVRHLRAFFGVDRAIDITVDRVTAYIAHRREQGAANASVNRELSALKRAFHLAYKAGRVGSRPEISLLHEAAPRKGFFSESEFRAVLAHLSDDIKPVVHTAFLTGWRVDSEILTRKKHNLDLSTGWLRLDAGETKNGEGRMFPLTPELREVLVRQTERTRALERASGQIIPWLFHRQGQPIRNFRHAWLNACKSAGIPGRRLLHDFRRTAVRNLERAGVSRSAAMAMIGHKTQAIYSRYAIADEASLKEAAVKLAALHDFDRLSKNVRSD